MRVGTRRVAIRIIDQWGTIIVTIVSSLAVLRLSLFQLLLMLLIFAIGLDWIQFQPTQLIGEITPNHRGDGE